MSSDRPKRNAIVSSARLNAKNALEALKAAREGGGAKTRTANYELKKEAPVYDVLDEEQYVKLVAKRRHEGGDFIVDDDGQGYADLGEEDDHWRAKGGEDGDEDDGEEHGGKKRKGAKGDDKSRKKGPAAAQDGKSGDIAKMFSKASARAALNAPTRAVRPAVAEDSDALLADILGDIGADPGSLAPAHAPPAHTYGGGAGAAAAGFTARPAVVAARPLPARAPMAAPHRVGPAVRPATRPAPAPHRMARQSSPAPAAYQYDEPTDMAVDDEPQAEEAHMEHEEGDDQLGSHAGEAAADAVPGDDAMQADTEPGGQQEARAPRGIGAVMQERSTAAASGWSTFCSTSQDDGEEDPAALPATLPAAAAASPQQGPAPATAAAPAAEQGKVAGAAPCLLPDGSMPFYFIDAFENIDARPGEVFLFGKVPLDCSSTGSTTGRPAPQAWASACAIIKACQRSIIVVPRSNVFADTDGSIAHLEALAAAATKEASSQLVEAGRRDAEAARYADKAAKAEAAAAAGSSGGAATGGGVPGREELSADECRSRQEEAAGAAGAAREAHAAALAKAAAAKLDLIKLLQSRCGELKAELREVLSRHGIKNFRMVPVKRSYAFENADIPRGEQWCIKVRYPASEPTLPSTTTGEHFLALFGAQTPCLESLLIKRKLKGPCWTVMAAPHRVDYSDQLSWCKVEVVLASPKSLMCDPSHPAIASRPAPPLTVASINLKTVIHPGTQQHEVVAAAVLHLSDHVDIEAPMTQPQWSKHQVLRNFCVVRKLDGQGWPPGFEQAVAAENNSSRGKANGGAMLLLQPSERSLLTTLLAKLQVLDADVLVGHNISAFDLHVLLTRMQHHKVPLWSRIGRLKRGNMPKLTGGGHAYGGGASAGALSAIAGRVLCDTYLSARELVREVDYTLRTLSKSLLNQDRGDLTSTDIPHLFNTTQGLMSIVRHCEGDAWLALGLMFHLSVLPLTRALTALSGFMWSKTLQGARAQRIEMLLLHEFHSRKFILPDKMSFKDREKAKGKAAKHQQAEEEAMMMDLDQEHGEEAGEGKVSSKPGAGKSGKGPQYLGGLVLEPKKGLYDRLVIMLDFNSLYPSIIQEFNICFSTVTRPTDGSMPPLPPGPAPGCSLAPLPLILQGLVQRRRQAKSALANARDPVLKQQLNIRQQALKLTANSMYGCLGFTSSRFYAKPLAELITSQGRSILQSTVDLVQGTLGAEVIYGDTDSIMINTGTTDLAAARELGARIKKEVNKRYKLLEIELDGIFKCMLLLKKKKYAAIKLEPGPHNQIVEIQEQKGLDIVRRDWCGLSKDAGHQVLQAVLSCRPCEEVVETIHDTLRRVREDVMSGTVPLNKFIITKQLTKQPEEYADARSQPHVQVALRRRAAGKRDGTLAGEAVPYVICVERPADTPAPAAAAAAQPGSNTPATAAGAPSSQVTPGAAGTPGAATAGAASATPGAVPGAASGGGAHGLADRAYHPEELMESGSRLMLDTEYYLGQQVHPVVSRLVAVLQGTDAARLAECLGLDASRYKGAAGNSSSYHGDADTDAFGGGLVDDDELYAACEPLMLTAPGLTKFEFKGALEVVVGRMTPDQLLCPPDAVGDTTKMLNAGQLTNQVVLKARELIAQYYDGWLDADDELARASHDASNNAAHQQGAGLRDIVLRPCGELERCPHPDAHSHATVLMARRMDERRLYLQLSHFQRLLNPELAVKRGLAQIKAKDPRSTATELELQGRLAPVAPALRAACDALERLRTQSSYHWVDLSQLFEPIKATAAAEAAADTAGPAALMAGV